MKLGMLGWFATLCSVACFVACANAASGGGTEDSSLDEFFRVYLKRLFEQEPLTATRLGEHGQDHRLDDLSKEARASRIARDRQTLEELERTVKYDKLSRDGQIDFEIFKHHLSYGLWLNEHFHPFEEDPRIWGDYATESVYLLLTQSTRPYQENLQNAIKRMGEVSRILATARETITKPDRVKTETAIRQTEGAVNFYEDGVFQAAGIAKGSGKAPALEEAAAQAAEAIRVHLRYLKEKVLPAAGEEWRIGPELFREKLKRELNSGLSADEVLAEAEREAVRVEMELAVVGRQLWSELFPDAPIPPDDSEGRREMVRKVLSKIGEERSTADTVLEDVKKTASEVKKFLGQKEILPLPEPDKCRIVEMPEFMRGNSTAYLNPAPPLDPEGSSEYAVSPPPAGWSAEQVESYFREYNREMLRILTIHEAYPGHYVQLEYSNRCPSLIRKVLSSGTFAEGWAVYTEQMMLDQGYQKGNLKLRMQQLKFYLRAVVNAILDHKMHAGDMTDEEAKELLMGRAFQTEGEALGKIIRSKQSSAQLSTYFVGRTAFYRLRQAIQREQGDKFDLRKFHEAVLAHGTLPVKYLPELVRRDLGLEGELGVNQVEKTD